mgnify:CR=1 FL=1|jgi:hypothetical protein
MSLEARIREDITTAMKAGERQVVDTLRMAVAALSRAQVDKRGQGDGDTDLSEDEEVKILRTCVKMRREAATAFRDGGAEDRALAEEEEGVILEAYLPQLMDAAATEAAVRAIATELDLSEPGDMGRLMGEAMKRHKGLLDGGLARTAAQTVLGG